MKKSKASYVALVGMLFALAMVLSFAEGAFAPAIGLPPGVKPGLANIIVMFALIFLGKKYALLLVVLKAVFGMLTRGITAGALSIGGGLLSLAVLCVLTSFKHQPTMLIISSCAAICHNIGQLLVLRFYITANSFSLYYLPILLVSGLVMGFVTSLLLKALIPVLTRFGFAIENNYQ